MKATFDVCNNPFPIINLIVINEVFKLERIELTQGSTTRSLQKNTNRQIYIAIHLPKSGVEKKIVSRYELKFVKFTPKNIEDTLFFFI